jgi:phytoene dehydrogenase-like protein
MKKFSLNDGGAVYGAAQEWAQTNLFRFPNTFHKKNLYFSSAWVTPGGGTSGALISAIGCVSKLLDYYGIKKEYDDFALPMPVPGDNRPENVR